MTTPVRGKTPPVLGMTTPVRGKTPPVLGMKTPVLGMVLKGYPRISETFISNEIALLESLGFTIHILSMRHPRENFTHASVGRIRARVDYLPETMAGNLGRLLAANLEWLVRHPVRYARGLARMVARLARTRKAATAKHLLQAGYLAARILPGSGVGHLHAHFAHSPTSVAAFASLLTGLPFSFTGHAKDIYTQNPDRLAEKMAEARFVVTCTGYNAEHLAGLAARNGHGRAGAAPKAGSRPGGTLCAATPVHPPIHRVYHGIDLSLFMPGEPRLTPAPPYEILTVARLTPKKGLPTVFAALAALQRRGVAFRHVLIGSGEEREALERLARELGIAGRIEWLGTQPHEVVVEHFRRADLFLLGCEVSENGDRDGIPNVLVESMAMGVPVAATRVSALPELIPDDDHGLLVLPGDPEALALAAKRLLTDRPLRRRVIENARARVAECFDNRRLAGDLAAIFRAHFP